MKSLTVPLALAALAASLTASPVSGTLYYTKLQGHPNVFSVPYNYDGTAFTLGLSTAVVDLPQSADGIMFGAGGTLIIGGQHSNRVYQVTKTGTILANPLTDSTSPEAAFHVMMDPTGNYVYSSDTYDGFGSGALEVLPVNGAGIIQTGTKYAVNGDDKGMNHMLFVPGYGWYYIHDDGNPNGNGNFGTVDLSSFTAINTTRIYTALGAAHSMAWDAYTSRITFFGGGAVASWDPANPTVSPLQRSGITCDFDQGAVDGRGHALIAGCNSITFIDYSATGDITSALNPTFVMGGYNDIDDVAPLSHYGSDQSTPEPATWSLLAGAGLLAAALRRRFA